MKVLNRIIVFFILLALLAFFLMSWVFIQYPRRYERAVVFASQVSGVNTRLIYAVAAVESKMNKNAVSHKGAVGIMQLLPATAAFAAEKYNIIYAVGDEAIPKVNLLLGALYLRYLLDKFAVEKTALAAYNAGEGRVCEWLENEAYSHDGKRLYKIPFRETKNYVKKVKRAKIFYPKRKVLYFV